MYNNDYKQCDIEYTFLYFIVVQYIGNYYPRRQGGKSRVVSQNGACDLQSTSCDHSKMKATLDSNKTFNSKRTNI